MGNVNPPTFSYRGNAKSGPYCLGYLRYANKEKLFLWLANPDVHIRVFCHFTASWTVLIICMIFIGIMSEGRDVSVEYITRVISLWFYIALPMLLLGFFVKRSSVIETGSPDR